MNKKISLILGLLFCVPALFFGTAQLVFATEIGGNTLDTVRGVEFQVQSAQSTLPGLAVPAYFLELVQGKGIKFSPTNSTGTANESPYNFAWFGLRGIGNLLDGWLRFNDAAGSEGFQWSKDDGLTWNNFGSEAVAESDPVYSAQKGAANGVATLGADSKVPSSQLPKLVITDVLVQPFSAVDTAEKRATLEIEQGDVIIDTVANKTYIWSGTEWKEIIAPNTVTSVNGQTGTVSLGLDSLFDVDVATCTATYVLKWNGTGWSCAPDSDSDVWTALTGGINYPDGVNKVGINDTNLSDTPALLQVGGSASVANDLGVLGEGVFGGAISAFGGARFPRQAGASVTPGRGPSISLESPSNNVTTSKGTPDLCDVVNECASDNTPNGNVDTEYVCPTGSGGLSYSKDVYQDAGFNRWHQTITCVAGTDSYSLGANAGALEFTNTSGDVKLRLAQDGYVSFFGSLIIPGGSSGNVLTKNADGTASWQPSQSGADNWGTQVVQRDASLKGNGTSASSLGLMACSLNGQILKWNSTTSTWGCDTDNSGGGSVWSSPDASGRISYTGGNVGIGTAAPTGNFQVTNNVYPGTVSVGNGSTIVDGSAATRFFNTFKSGDTITVAGAGSRTVSTITSDTRLTVSTTFLNTLTGASYTATPSPNVSAFLVRGSGNTSIGGGLTVEQGGYFGGTVSANLLQMRGGSPAADKFLKSTDASGNAVWDNVPAAYADGNVEAWVESKMVDGDFSATLSTVKIKSALLPDLVITDTYPVSDGADADTNCDNEIEALTNAKRGDVAICSNTNTSYILSTDAPSTFSNWIKLLALDSDADSSNEIQTLSLGADGKTVTISRAASNQSVTINTDDADANPTNEAQTLTYTDSTRAVNLSAVGTTGGGSFILPQGSKWTDIGATGIAYAKNATIGRIGDWWNDDDASTHVSVDIANADTTGNAGPYIGLVKHCDGPCDAGEWNSAAQLKLIAPNTIKIARPGGSPINYDAPANLVVTGNVGIGTASPTTQNGNVTALLALSGTGNSNVGGTITGTAVDTGLIMESRFTGQTSGITRGAQIFLARESASLTVLDSNIQFLTTSAGTIAERMRISAAGNVGIGTAAPTYAKLDVRDTNSFIQIRSSIPAIVTGTNNGGAIYFGVDNTNLANVPTAAIETSWGDAFNPQLGIGVIRDGLKGNILMDFSSNIFLRQGTTNRLVVDGATGNVGIGTAGPGVKTEIKTAITGGMPATSGTTQTNGILRLASSNAGVSLDFGVDGEVTAASWIQATAQNDLSQKWALLLNPNGGNVGIGTAAPNRNFDVMYNNSDGITFGRDGTSDNSATIQTYIDGHWNDRNSYAPWCGSGGCNLLRIQPDGGSTVIGGDVSIVPNGSGDMAGPGNLTINNALLVRGGIGAALNAANVPQFTVTPDGKVGIGVANPSYQLMTKDDGGFLGLSGGNITLSNIIDASASRGLYYVSTGDFSQWKVPVCAWDLSNVVQNNNPEDKKSAAADGVGAGHVCYDQYQVVDTQTGTSVRSVQYTVTNFTGDSATPPKKIIFEDASTNGLSWSVTNNAGDLKFVNGAGNISSPQLTISQSGGIVIGTGGSITADAFTADAFFYRSDRDLKQNIAPLAGSLEKVLKLQGVSFNWKESGDKSIGLIAQDVEEVYPELVSGEEGHKTLQYGNLVAPLIEAVKELNRKVEDQQKEIDALKAK